MSAVASTHGVTAGENPRLDQLCISTIRGLSIDAVQRANSGHPGLPLGMAPVAHVLFSRYLSFDPARPEWPDRDRFVLSAGHGSMLLYAMLHLSGYAVSLSDLQAFRQWGSPTPGHPEHGHTSGVETTTGPLGQGFANGVGMAMAERFLRERYGPELVDHRVFGICSDGDLMEGVSAEAASLAGHLGLGRIVYLYDDNRITIDGSTDLSFSTEDVGKRFRAYGWHTVSIDDANDLPTLREAIDSAIAEDERPSLIRVHSVIGYPSPGRQGTPQAHGQPLGVDEVRATKNAMGLDPDAEFAVPEAVRGAYSVAAARGRRARLEWESRLEAFRESDPEQAATWDRSWRGEVEPGVSAAIPCFQPEERPKLSTRAAGGRVMAAVEPFVPTMIGGAADLVESTKTCLPGRASFTRECAGANVHWGVREHAMGAAVNGLALHGGIVRPWGSTFLVFSDYMRPAIRLSALMQLPVVWVFSHDSVAVGEDGPTHQPVEHYAALRAIPGLTVIRPADANETAISWRVALEHEGPVCLLLSRQDLDVLHPEAVGDGPLRGGYVLSDAEDEVPEVVLVASGSEVGVALAAKRQLAGSGHRVRVVSMPSWELFDSQPEAYRRAVLMPGIPTVSVEAGVAQGWQRFCDGSVSIERFGASAPGPTVMAELGITAERVAAAARAAIDRSQPA
ncbi:MAG TPA: transketolase [Solirubrobacteraceae bacterium]|nr:transketolase [Solirubrobacteraceae bacterium]